MRTKLLLTALCGITSAVLAENQPLSVNVGNFARAQALTEEALAVLQETGAPAWNLGHVHTFLGGAYFGLQSNSIKNSIELGPTGTPQVQAAKKVDDANTAGSRANILYIAGGTAAVVGAVLIAVDGLRGGPTPAASISVGAHSSVATLTWTF